MRKSVLGLALVLAMALNIVPVMADTADMDMSNLSVGTYKVMVADGADKGYLTVADENDEVQEFVIITGEDYGYIYFDKQGGKTYDFKDVVVELVSEDDLGVSGYHVYQLTEDYRSYDPIVDGEDYVPMGSEADFQ